MEYISKINIGGMDYDIRDKVLEQEVANIKPIVNQGTINNAADEEDLTSENNLIKFKDRSTRDGMGYIILRKNKTFSEQITQANTIYEIRYDFDLVGGMVEIPANCVLKFNGGSLKNGTLIGNNTTIAAHRVKIFNTDIQITGTWNISCIYPEWFGAKNDGVIDSTNAIQKAIDFAHNIAGGEIKLSIGKYLISSTLYLYRRVSIIGCGVHSQTLNQQMNTTTQFICKFNNYNSWCFDTYCRGTLADHNDIFFLNNEKNSNYERNEGICLKGFSIACPKENPVYGAIRLWNTLQGIIENISIYGTIFGIAITESWGMHIKDCFIGTYRYGIGFGEYNTTNTVTNIYLSRHRWNLPIDFDLPIVDDDFYPPYIAKNVGGIYEELTDTIKKEFSSAFFFSASNFGTRICIISPIIEFYECAFCGSAYAGEIINPYIEGFGEESLDKRTKYIAWIGGTLRTQLSLLIFGYAGSATKIEKTKYTYGSRSTRICVKGSFFGSCYTPVFKANYDPMSTTEIYIFEEPFNTSLPYYDDYDENNLENSIKCPMKKLVGYDKIFAFNSGISSNINNIAIEPNHRVPLHEALKRCVELHINKISLVSEVILEKPINTIKNTYIKFYNAYINEPAKIQIEDYPLKIDNSDLYFIATDTSVKLASSKTVDYAIEVKGVCNIKAIGKKNNPYSGITSTTIQHLLHIIGDSDITITCESQDDLTYRLSDDKLLFDRNVPYKYSIKVYHQNGLFLKELCNYKGTTTNRPNFTEVQGSEGFEYYDSDLKKKIIWNGTAWVNLDGTGL